MSERVAVIAVHGVADQQPGDTAQALVKLLVGGSLGEGRRYQACGDEGITLAVDPLRPHGESSGRSGPPTPFTEDRGIGKSVRQSWRSDLVGQASPDEDAGLQLTHYLLGKHEDNGGVREPYATTVSHLERREGGRLSHQVDVFEMYWADLSRLSNKVPRIVGELFTLLFRFSRLGRDTVQLAQSLSATGMPSWRRAAWRMASGLQLVLDALLVHVIGMLTLQLLIAGLIVLLVGAAWLDARGYRALLLPVLPWVLIVAGALLLRYRAADMRPRDALWPSLLLGGGLAAFVLPQGEAWTAVFALLGLITAGLWSGLKVADDRFPLVKYTGMGWWGLALCVMLWQAVSNCDPVAFACPGAWPLPGLLDGALRAMELNLYWGFKQLWTWVLAPVLLLWVASAAVAGWRAGFDARATLATGRLGALVSLGAFLALAMAVWALASKALPQAVGWLHYDALWLSVRPSGELYAAEFLRERFTASTAGFVLIVAAFAPLLLFLVSAFLPSILAEMLLLVDRKRQAVRRQAGRRQALREAAPPAAGADRLAERLERGRRARQLGKWLTWHYRWLDALTLLVALLGLLGSLLVAAAFLLPSWQAVQSIYDELMQLSGGLLRSLALSAAGALAFLIAFGGLLSKYAPTLRGPLDIALDVDNHFREFPRDQIPRARIFSRFAALLREVGGRGYDRVVIVAHSQGTVISAELLRYLSSDATLCAPQAGAVPAVPGVHRFPPISLFTLGSPLRQLYAARFPHLYDWMLRAHGAECGPQTWDVGVARWFNAFCSGDYVGRWLWSHHSPDAQGLPTSDTTRPETSDDAPLRRLDAYALLDIPPPGPLPALARCDKVETCLGVGAHTHYFDAGQDAVAWLVDHLVATAPKAAP